MFGDLSKLSEQKFEAHPIPYYETNDQRYALEVFAAYETTTDFYYIETQFTDETYAQFLSDIQQRSVIEMAVNITESDRIITFSTCTTSQNDKERFVVHAKVTELEVNEGWKIGKLITALLAVSVLAACGQKEDEPVAEPVEQEEVIVDVSAEAAQFKAFAAAQMDDFVADSELLAQHINDGKLEEAQSFIR